MPELRGIHAIVTGGSSGIGLATARELCVRGARVSIVARSQDRLATAAIELGKPEGRGVHVAAADVTDRSSLQTAFAALEREQGPCGLLVNSAGAIRPGYFEDLSRIEPDHFEAMMNVNYFGKLNAVRLVVPGMLARRTGGVVGIASTAASIGVFGYTAYAASKFAVRGLFESLRSELAPHGVYVGCAFPPDTATPGLTAEELTKPVESKAVTGAIRALEARDVARAIVGGIARDKSWIFCDYQTRAIASLAGAAHGLFEFKMDALVRKARMRP